MRVRAPLAPLRGLPCCPCCRRANDAVSLVCLTAAACCATSPLSRQAHEGVTTGAWSDEVRLRVQRMARDWREAGVHVDRLADAPKEFVLTDGNLTLRSGQDRHQAITRLHARG